MKLLGYLGAGYGVDENFNTSKHRYRAYWDRNLQALATADLGEYGGRYRYYWGRFPDVTHQAVLRRFLKSGDTYIDIGANLGFQSIYASRLVGEAGRVLSFEPHPETFRLLNAHLAMNGLFRCSTFNMALSDEPGELLLNEHGPHSGTATFLRSGSATRCLPVKVERGDDVLPAMDLPGDIFVKIDVEGFERKVLRGLRRTLSRVKIAAVEVTPEWLSAVGDNAEELYAEMRDLGFQAYRPHLRWKCKMWSPTLEVPQLTSIPPEQHDILFMR
jgi:FkbM family methyltransferase